MGNPPLPSKYCGAFLATLEAELTTGTETSSVRSVKASSTFTHRRVNWETENNPKTEQPLLDLYKMPCRVQGGPEESDIGP